VARGKYKYSGDYREDVLSVLSELLGDDEDVELGQMMGSPAFYCLTPSGKRKMFACVYGPGVALKLPREMADNLIGEAGIEPWAPGRAHVMGGWVLLIRADAQDYRDELELLRLSIDHTSGA